MLTQPIVVRLSDYRVGQVVGFVSHHTSTVAIVQIVDKLERHDISTLFVLSGPDRPV